MASSDSAQCWCVYLVASTVTKRTYVGKTNSPVRRLRQHNGEVKGGAKATRTGRPWEFAIIVYGFADEVQALQFEWAL